MAGRGLSGMTGIGNLRGPCGEVGETSSFEDVVGRLYEIAENTASACSEQYGEPNPNAFDDPAAMVAAGSAGSNVTSTPITDVDGNIVGVRVVDNDTGETTEYMFGSEVGDVSVTSTSPDVDGSSVTVHTDYDGTTTTTHDAGGGKSTTLHFDSNGTFLGGYHQVKTTHADGSKTACNTTAPPDRGDCGS
jgi:hypothetical protein